MATQLNIKHLVGVIGHLSELVDVRRDIRSPKALPTFPWIDNCPMVTKMEVSL